MSREAFSRALSRETSIWTPFVYAMTYTDGQNIERVMILGLYAYGYRNQHAYLEEIESDELANLLADYNSKIAELTADERNTIADIVSKRYLAAIDGQIHDEKMRIKRIGIEADGDEWDAKLAALDADRAALTTMMAKVATATVTTNARIMELNAQIQTETVNQKMVEIDRLEKKITLSSKDLAILEVGNAVLKIQLDIVEAGYKLIEVDQAVSRARIENTKVRLDIAEAGLLDSDLSEAEAQVKLAEAELTEYDVKIAKAEIAITETEIDSTQEDITLIEVDGKAAGYKLDTAKMQIAENEIDLLDADIETAKARKETKIAETETLEAREKQLEAEKKAESARVKASEADLETYGTKLTKIAAEMIQSESQTTQYTAMAADETAIAVAKRAAMDSETAERLSDIELTRTRTNLSAAERVATSELDLSLSNKEVESREAIDAVWLTGEIAQRDAARIAKAATLYVAEQLAKANIATQLTHMIGSG